MSEVNWANAVSMVATVDGLLVTERGADGMVGAAPKVLRAMTTAERQPTAWGKNEYVIHFSEASKSLKKPGPKIGTMLFIATETDALNWVQSMAAGGAPLGYCALLFRVDPAAGGGAVDIPGQKTLVWSNCKLTGYYTADGSLVKAG